MATIEYFLAAPDVLGLRIVTGSVADGRTVDYVPQAGDVIDGSRRVTGADGQVKGVLVGSDNSKIQTFDKFIADGSAGDFANTAGPDSGISSTAIIDQLSGWTVTVNGATVGIEELFRKTKVLESAEIDSSVYRFVQEHIIHVNLAQPVKDGDRITVNPAGSGLPSGALTVDVSEMRSEAVHVNQNGFDPQDTRKVAYLSSWLGQNTALAENAPGGNEALTYAPGTNFYLVDNATGQRVFTGQIALERAATDPTNFQKNFALADSYVMDFSSFNREGSYRVEVEGIGTSYDFEISDHAWEDMLVTGLRGFYHQRSGIALTEEYTDWTRPRSLHPADGIQILQSDVKLMDTNMGYDPGRPDAFAALRNGATSGTVAEAWGGWHDAGDWDRRAQHLDAVDLMLEMFTFNKAYYETVELNIPESGDTMPDVIDEALWTLDFFMRLQKADGGVPGGVEQEEHPKESEASWTNSLKTYVYAPDAWSSFKFAASAARAYEVVKDYDAARAAQYLQAAEKAYAWAEANIPATRTGDQPLIDAQNLAAVELFKATGNAGYNSDFLATSSFAAPGTLAWNQHQYDAAFAYWRMGAANNDPAIRARIEADFIAEANFMVSGFGDRGVFGETVNPWAPHGWGSTATNVEEAARVVLRAYEITKDPKYLAALYDNVQFALGANPDNISFVTGVGDEQMPEILVVDAEALGRGPPPGITIYGTYDPISQGWQWWQNVVMDSMYPKSPYFWPAYENWNGFFFSAIVSEFTVDQMMGNAAYLWGYLAQLNEAGNAGMNKVSGTAAANTLAGTANADFARGFNGNDRIAGGTGNDMLYGDDGNDVLFGGAGLDVNHGGVGRDTMSYAASRGAVVINLATGDGRFADAQGDRLTSIEVVAGSRFNDRMTGSAKHDTLQGGAGNDTLAGGLANDWLYGGAGADVLTGGAGHDILSGGAGNDLFRYAASGNGRDKITDFDAGAGVGDRLDLRLTDIDTFAELVTRTRDDASMGGAFIDLGSGSGILLTGVARADLAADDFLF